jgi:hypothetical protein
MRCRVERAAAGDNGQPGCDLLADPAHLNMPGYQM